MEALYDKFLETLELHGVKYIFGLVGDAINPLVESIRKQDKIKFVHVNHEEGGALAASAISKLTRNLQVCAGTLGPGALHLLNGLYDARKDHTPLLAILGQVPTGFLGTDYHQEIQLSSVFEHVAVYSHLVSDPVQFPFIVAEACNTAIERRGVSVLIVPQNLGSEKVIDAAPTVIRDTDLGKIVPGTDLMKKAVAMIDKEKKISILAGEGCRGSEDKVLQLSEKLQAPVIISLRAKELFHYKNERVAGGLGLLGSRGGVHAMNSCELLLILGSDFPYRNWYNSDSKIVRIDNRASALGHRTPGVLAVHGDTEPTVDFLLDQVQTKKDSSHFESTMKMKKLWDVFLEKTESPSRSKNLIHPQGLTKVISELADDDAIFTCDTGEVTVWAARHLYLHDNQRFSASFSLASMAYALPAAIGAQLTYPGRQVISLSGDGGFNMLMGEFLTAVKYKLPIKVIVYNNAKLGLIKMEQEVEGYPEYETGLQNPDYVRLANAMGGKGYRIEKPVEIKSGLKKAFTEKGPVIIDVHINPDEMTLPPKITVNQAYGYGLSKVREILE